MIIYMHGREVFFDIVRGHSYFSNMTKLNVAISEEDIGWAKSRVAAGEIDKGLASGVDPRSSRQIFADMRAKYLGENG